MGRSRNLAMSFGAWLVVADLCRGATPSIFITSLPSHGSTNDLQGKVLNANPATHAVAVFIYVPGYGWVSKPTCGQPLTSVQTNGTWSADITTGGGDTNATRIAAVLVGTNYNEPCVLGLANLPANIYAQAVAKTVITRPSFGVRFLSFSGYDWWVKNFATLAGPGPNYFSDGTNNVWTDGAGRLHLRITNRSNQWQCAELISARTFGTGSYRFELDSPADGLDPNVTLGLFTWSDDPAYTFREIDVECGRWGNAGDVNNSQFVVQPYNVSDHLTRYRVPPGLTNSTHLFVWETNRVGFQCQSNGYSPAGTNLVSSWVFTNAPAVPQSGDENVRLNLWLVSGGPPTDSNEVEVVIKSFRFVPLEPPARALLGKLQFATAGPWQFEINTQPDFCCEVQTSTNLRDWQSLGVVLATNDVMTFPVANSAGSSARFYRAATLP